MTVIGVTSPTSGTSVTTVYTGSGSSAQTSGSSNSEKINERKGKTIGIGVGAAVGALLVLGLAIVLIKWRTRNSQRGPEPCVAELPTAETSKAELPGQEPGGSIVYEKTGRSYHLSPYSELDGTGVRSEMSG